MNMSKRNIPSEGPAERATVTLPRSLARRLRLEAEASGRPISSVVREALEEYLREDVLLPSFTGVAGSGRSDTSERTEELIRRRMKRRRRS